MSADLRRFAWSFFEFRPHLPPVEWCEAELNLSPLVSAQPGPYSTFSRAHVREPLNCFGDTTTSDLVLCWAAQTDKSTTLTAGTLYRVKNRPTPSLIVFPNEDLAGSYSENRLIPLIDSSDQLRALRPKDGDKFKRLEMQMSTCTLALVGSNSPANLASRPVGLLVADEVNKFKRSDGKEAGALQLATERTKAFEPTCKRVYASTPTVEDDEGIWALFLQGDQCYRYVPCKHCGEFIRFELAGVKWDQGAKDPKTGAWDYARVKKSAHYECKCGGKITDADKTKMLRAGEWRPSNPHPLPGWRSFQLPSLYSVNITFGKFAVSFIQSQHGTLSERQNFINSWLAEPWTADKPIKVTDEHLQALLGTTERAAFDSADGGVNVMISDAQRDSFPWIVRRFYRGMRSHLVDWGIALGADQLDDRFAHYQCSLLGIDTGHRTQEIYELVAQRPGKWIALKGQPGTMAEFFRESSVDPYTGKKDAGKMKIPLLLVNDEHWSRELFDRLDGRVSGWKLTKEIDAVYQHQITGVRRVPLKKKDGTTETKLRYRPPYDLWDAEKYALCLSYVVGFGRGEVPTPDNSPPTDAPTVEIEF